MVTLSELAHKFFRLFNPPTGPRRGFRKSGIDRGSGVPLGGGIGAARGASAEIGSGAYSVG